MSSSIRVHSYYPYGPPRCFFFSFFIQASYLEDRSSFLVITDFRWISRAKSSNWNTYLPYFYSIDIMYLIFTAREQSLVLVLIAWARNSGYDQEKYICSYIATFSRVPFSVYVGLRYVFHKISIILNRLPTTNGFLCGWTAIKYFPCMLISLEFEPMIIRMIAPAANHSAMWL